MTTVQTSPAESRGHAWGTRRHRGGAYSAAPEVSPGRSVNSPAPIWRSDIAARPKVTPGSDGREARGLLIAD
jgi:hypothetical protein